MNETSFLTILSVLLILAFLCGSGCEEILEEEKSPPIVLPTTLPPTVSPSSTMVPQTVPSLRILSPGSPLSTILGTNVTIEVEVNQFKLVEKFGIKNVAGEGHLLYYLDTDVLVQEGSLAGNESRISEPTISTTYTWSNLTTTVHTFSVQLVNNDHSPLQPPIFKTVTVSLIKQAPEPTSPPSLTPQPTVPQKLTIFLMAKNFLFNRTAIIAPPDTRVELHFQNMDSVKHNVAIYSTPDGKGPIFIGTLIDSTSTTYSFITPATPGTYYFRSDSNPYRMQGEFIVRW